MTPLRKNRRRTVSARILAGILATAAAAILFAMFSSDATRAIIANATQASFHCGMTFPSVGSGKSDPWRSSRHNGRGGADA